MSVPGDGDGDGDGVKVDALGAQPGPAVQRPDHPGALAATEVEQAFVAGAQGPVEQRAHRLVVERCRDRVIAVRGEADLSTIHRRIVATIARAVTRISAAGPAAGRPGRRAVTAPRSLSVAVLAPEIR